MGKWYALVRVGTRMHTLSSFSHQSTGGKIGVDPGKSVGEMLHLDAYAQTTDERAS